MYSDLKTATHSNHFSKRFNSTNWWIVLIAKKDYGQRNGYTENMDHSYNALVYFFPDKDLWNNNKLCVIQQQYLVLLVLTPRPRFLFNFIFNKMNVNVRLIRLRCVVFLLFHFYTLSSTIIHSTFGHLRHGWGIQPSHFPCDGLKTSGSRISLGVESVVSFKIIKIIFINIFGRLDASFFILGSFPFDTSSTVKSKEKMFRVVL